MSHLVEMWTDWHCSRISVIAVISRAPSNSCKYISLVRFPGLKKDRQYKRHKYQSKQFKICGCWAGLDLFFKAIASVKTINSYVHKKLNFIWKRNVEQQKVEKCKHQSFSVIFFLLERLAMCPMNNKCLLVQENGWHVEQTNQFVYRISY